MLTTDTRAALIIGHCFQGFLIDGYPREVAQGDQFEKEVNSFFVSFTKSTFHMRLNVEHFPAIGLLCSIFNLDKLVNVFDWISYLGYSSEVTTDLKVVLSRLSVVIFFRTVH